MIERQQFRQKIHETVIPVTPTILDNEYKTSLQELYRETDVDVDKFVTRFETEGLDDAAVKKIVNQVKQHLSVSAHATVIETKAVERHKMPIGLDTDLTDQVIDKQTELFRKDNYVSELITAAMEVAIMCRRLQRYTEVGDTGDTEKKFSAILDGFQRGSISYNQLKSHEHFTTGLDRIIGQIDLEVGKKFTVWGVGEIDIDTPETKQAIEHHLKFVLQTELAQLAEVKNLGVLSSAPYDITKPKSAFTKFVQGAKTIITSGSFWGVTTTAGAHFAMGSEASAVGVIAATAVGAGVIGAAAGNYWEKWNQADRLKLRKFEAAVGLIEHPAAKSAEMLEGALVPVITALQADPSEANIIDAYTVVADIQERLHSSKKDKQDYISFGKDNRFKAQTDLLDNLEKALAAIELALDGLTESERKRVQSKLNQVHEQTGTALKKQLDRKITADQKARRTRSTVIGGLSGIAGSVVTHLMYGYAGSTEHINALTGSILGGAGVEVGLSAGTAFDDMNAKIGLLKKAGSVGPTETTVAETELPDINEQVEQTKAQELRGTIASRKVEARVLMNNTIKHVDRILAATPDLKKIGEAITNKTPVTDDMVLKVMSKLDKVTEVFSLLKNIDEKQLVDADFQYEDVDRDTNRGSFNTWSKVNKWLFHLPDTLSNGIQTALATLPDQIVQARTDKNKLEALKAKLAPFAAAADYMSDEAKNDYELAVQAIDIALETVEFVETHRDIFERIPRIIPDTINNNGTINPDFIAEVKKIKDDLVILRQAVVTYQSTHAGALQEFTWLVRLPDKLIIGVSDALVQLKREADAERKKTTAASARKAQLDRLRDNVFDLSVVSLEPIVEHDFANAIELRCKIIVSEINRAVMVINFWEKFGDKDEVKEAIMAGFKKAGCFDDADPSLPKSGKEKYFQALLAGGTLQDMGFVEGKVKKTVNTVRITEVLDRLFKDESDIFKKP
ncbi:MAG: hypothetical protein WCV88_02940 [Patescibacteria group bacterium]|jgi:hypothetical protein